MSRSYLNSNEFRREDQRLCAEMDRAAKRRLAEQMQAVADAVVSGKGLFEASVDLCRPLGARRRPR